jgi:peptidoglycan/xylan/chitin deacetylase (PgdA/CDA1 family)
MEKQLGAYADVVAGYDAAPSLPITAAVLDRNPQVAHGLAGRGVELCVHGLVHNDLSELSPETQREQIEQAVAVFTKHGVSFEGFRSPYLRYNEGTLSAVRALDFEYDSNLPFYWEPERLVRDLDASQADGLRRGLRFYNPVRFPHERSLPRFAEGLVEIPVSLPDDEILLDRMGLSPQRIGETWQQMAGLALERGELLTIQLHPERIALLRESLRRVLDFASASGGFWITTMAEIAAWWKERTPLAIDVTDAGRGKYEVKQPVGTRSQLELVVPATGTRQTIETRTVVASEKKPVIGVHPASALHLRHRIRDLGYCIDESEDSKMYPYYVGGDDPAAEVERRIIDLDHPLVADTFWPAPHKAALAVTGDIDCLTLGDFIRRFREG